LSKGGETGFEKCYGVVCQKREWGGGSEKGGWPAERVQGNNSGMIKKKTKKHVGVVDAIREGMGLRGEREGGVGNQKPVSAPSGRWEELSGWKFLKKRNAGHRKNPLISKKMKGVGGRPGSRKRTKRGGGGSVLTSLVLKLNDQVAQLKIKPYR